MFVVFFCGEPIFKRDKREKSLIKYANNVTNKMKVEKIYSHSVRFLDTFGLKDHKILGNLCETYTKQTETRDWAEKFKRNRRRMQKIIN